MIAKTDYEELLKKVEKLRREMKDIRQILLQKKPENDGKSKNTWDNLIEISKDISQKWKGPTGTEEIRDQRTKDY